MITEPRLSASTRQVDLWEGLGAACWNLPVGFISKDGYNYHVKAIGTSVVPVIIALFRCCVASVQHSVSLVIALPLILLYPRTLTDTHVYP